MNSRIKSITDAATDLFLRQGYARTQISHIAKAAGISVGSIYNDFSGKQEIMHFVLKCTIDPDFLNREFERPITDDLFGDLNSEIMSLFKQTGADLLKPLEHGIGSYTFEELIADAFDLLARYAVGCLFIEKNQYDFKVLADSYKTYRRHFFDTMLQYLMIFIENGTVRPLDHPQLAVTMIIEILTWWSMDRRYISFEPSDVSLTAARQICVDTIIHAYKN